MKIVGVIPARYKSSRFPGKPLVDIGGKPLVWWVYQQAVKVSDFQAVYIATDDERIISACKTLNMPVVSTSEKHMTGTDRVGEVAQKVKADLYVNIQGDEPLIEPEAIKSAINPFCGESIKADVSNLMTRIKRFTDISSVTVPKVVCNSKGEAVFLSRLPIPYPKNAINVSYYKQVCVYAFRPEALRQFCSIKRGPIELAEDIELLRFIENGIKVQMVEVNSDTIAVDVPSDLDEVKPLLLVKKREFTEVKKAA